MPVTVVVVGASGFIGQALVRELVQRRISVTAVSRRACSFPANVMECIVDDYGTTPSDPDAVLVHLAEKADVGEAEKLGHGHLSEVGRRVEALLAKKFARFVYISSGRVYKATIERPRSPADPTTADLIYETAKLAAEDLVRSTDGVIVRLGNVYGPPLKAGTVLSDIVRQIPGTEPVVVKDNNPARDFLWIEDAARGLADIALGTATGTFNLGTGISTSAAQLARIALEAAGDTERTVIAIKPKQNENIDSIALDISATTAQFGWRPSTPLSAGIKILLQGTP